MLSHRDGSSSVTDVDFDTVGEGAVGQSRRHAHILGRFGFAPGSLLGRYEIIEKLGEGGMGVVYAAHDPELLRRVALKLVAPIPLTRERAARRRARLLREAQVMARLCHPNVLRVYDIGTYGDHVYMALELVDGETVSRWTKRMQPSWRDVLEVYLAAGKGLAAAHAAGIVHRDFKPQNVLLDQSGRVLVTDFGLARASDETAPPGAAVIESWSGAAITNVGTVMGTPGFAAPEHVHGLPADVRSDQFSFAAALWTGLYGEEPFPSTEFDEYAALLARGLPRPPSGRSVPSWLRRIVERGLAIDPNKRFKSLDAMLDALARGLEQPPRRGRGLAVGGIAVCAGAALALATAATRPHEAVCGDAAAPSQVWNPIRAAQLRLAFIATGSPEAMESSDRVRERLDGRAEQLRRARVAACEATRVRHEQTEAVLARRMSCFDQRERELGEIVEIFLTADRRTVTHAVGVTRSLSPLDDCDRRILASEAPATDARGAEIRSLVARTRSLSDAGKLEESITVGVRALDLARAANLRGLEAEVLLGLGSNQSLMGRYEPAANALREAVRAADASGDDTIRARALARLVGVLGSDMRKPQEALAYVPDVLATLERMGGDRRAEAMLGLSLSQTHRVLRNHEEVRAQLVHTLAIMRELHGEEAAAVATVHNNLGSALMALGQPVEAADEYRAAHGIFQRLLGDQHPATAMARINLISLLIDDTDPQDSIRNSAEVIETMQRALAPLHPHVVYGRYLLAIALAKAGLSDQALGELDAVIADIEDKPELHTAFIDGLTLRARHVFAVTNRGKLALRDADKALKLARALGPGEEERVGRALFARALALQASSKRSAAIAELDRATAMFDKFHGGDHPNVLELLIPLAELHLAKGNSMSAIATLERALAICQRARITGFWLTRTQTLLERARSSAKAAP